MKPHPRSLPVVVVLGLALFLTPSPQAKPDEEREVELEKPDDPPAPYSARFDALARSPSAGVVQGPYVSYQANVDALGQNIVGDAANEPSIAVSPTNPANMVIGWRQFDSVASNFRQAGWSYSFDGGHTWTFPGVLELGVFRSDPVLDTDSHGNFYYQSLKGDLTADVWRSTNGGVSWSAPVSEFGGDKNWFVVDKSGGASDGHLYGIWQRFAACCGASVFTRSINGGASFQAPVQVARWPTFGTLAVGPNGEVYAAGIEGVSTQDFAHFVAAKSANASNPAVNPTFTGVRVNLIGGLNLGAGPNPEGLLGQANVAVDSSNAPTRGNAYVAAAVAGADPMDVMIARSTNGGTTWDLPVRVNDDASQENWQWMAAHSVSRNGRIDVVWNDSRQSGQPNLVQLYYAYSWDGGVTWSPNVAVSPEFNTLVGFPNQNKIGDYYTIVSGDTGADVAYSATFNGEQDVWYLRVFPDCNGNALSDVTDVANASSTDCNANHVPDECETPVCGASAFVASTAAADTCAVGGAGSANGVVDPGEDVALPVTLRNDGTVALTNVSATLATSTPGVTVTRAGATFADVATGGTASSNAPHFGFTVDASVACGTSIGFTLTVNAAQGSWSRPFAARVGTQTTTSGTIASSDVPKTINDLTVNSSTLTIPTNGTVVDLDVVVTLTHSFVGDVVLVLVAPNGKRDLLSYSDGGAGQGYTNTRFNDEASARIDLGTAPFNGQFKPRQVLSSFDGGAANGTWTLEIEDIGPGDTGTLTSWSLIPTIATGFACNACGLAAPTQDPLLSWSGVDDNTLQWSAVAGAAFYNVYRGVAADLPKLVTAASDSCLRASPTATTSGPLLTESPPAGEFYWYLVRAANGGGQGPAGNATAGARSQQGSGACP